MDVNLTVISETSFPQQEKYVIFATFLVVRPSSQLTIVQFLKSEAATTERSKIVSCFTHRFVKKKT